MTELHYTDPVEGQERTLAVREDDSSYHYKALMGDNSVTLKFSLTESIDFPVGTWIMFNNVRYTLTRPENWNRKGDANLEYTLVLEGVQSSLGRYKLRDMVDGRLKFGMTATPQEFLKLITDNINKREDGWTGACLLEAKPKTVEFNHDYISDALPAVADAFGTEYEITDGKEIRLGKVEYFKSRPLPLSYGKGNGFKPGTGRTNTDDSRPAEILYVQGGERNIDPSKYDAKELHLPKGQTLEYNGTTYRASEDGLSMQVDGKSVTCGNEDSYDGSEIYPSRVGKVTEEVTEEGKDSDGKPFTFHDFIDNTIPDTLDYSQCGIAGETATVVFQTGMLAGREFDIMTDGDGKMTGYDHKTRRFRLVPQEIDGVMMPGGVYIPKEGDEYAVFGISLPDDYIRNDDGQSGAEWDLFKEAARYMDDNKDFKFTFSGELQGKWARENWTEGLSVGSQLVIGGYIRFTDTHFAPEGIDIRITGVKTYLGDPFAPVIEISNGTAARSGLRGALHKVDAHEVQIGQARTEGMNFTKRQWRSVRETMGMLEAAWQTNFAGFSESVNPLTVQAMTMLIGDESLQFVFVDSKEEPQNIVRHREEWDSRTRTFTMGEGILKHCTLGMADIKGAGQRNADEYHYWNLPGKAFNLANDGLSGKKYYLYAKCGKDGEKGEFIATEEPVAMEAEEGYYHFLMGVLNAETGGERSYVPLYGFTEVLPGRITADRIVSGDGRTYWDLVKDSFSFGGRFDYNTEASGPGNLLLRGTFIQTGNGDRVPVGAWCGEWDEGRTYQNGDQVVWTDGNGNTSTYRYVNSVPTSGTTPADGNYWTVEAAGTDSYLEHYEKFPYRIETDTEGSDTLAYGESLNVTCHVFKGFDDVTAFVTGWKIERDTGDELADNAWALKDKAKYFQGKITITHTEEESDLGKTGVSTLFTITATVSDGKTVMYSIAF